MACGPDREQMELLLLESGAVARKVAARRLACQGGRVVGLSGEAAGALVAKARRAGWIWLEVDASPEVGQIEALPPEPPPPAWVVVREESRVLPCALTAEEVLQHQAEVARCEIALRGLAREERAWKTLHAERCAPHKSLLGQLVGQLESGARLDAVQVVHELDTSGDTVREVRVDTGEVLSERPATGEDRQLRLRGAQ
jgi:hypothetical protein